MIKPAADPCGIVAADLEGLADAMARPAFALDSRDGCSDAISDSRILSHVASFQIAAVGRFMVLG
jgi:hypothetical protein